MLAKSLIAATIAGGLLVAGCTQNTGNKEIGGTLLGAGLGGMAGAQFGGGKGQLAATAVGVLAGAWLGNEVGKSLDRADRIAAARTAQVTLESAPTGQTATWSNPDSGHSGTVTPVRTYQEPSGAYCREYQQSVTVGGQTERAYGTACRQPDGSWKIINS